MKLINKIFGGINLTWLKLIIMAIVIGIYTGVVMVVPIFKDTSFRDLGATFEVWIFFGIFIIMNSKSTKDAALKCFVFFLISQPLIYLIQVPFSWMGWGLFGYYKYWFIWTILCLPMGYIGYHLKDNKWYGLLILTPMILLTAFEYHYYFGDLVGFFPNHLLTCIFCVVACIVYSLVCFKDKKYRIIEIAISLILIIAITLLTLNKGGNTYQTTILLKDIVLEKDTKVYLKDSKYGTLELYYEEGIQEYAIRANFTDTGDTEIILELDNGEIRSFPINVNRTSYEIKYDEPNNVE